MLLDVATASSAASASAASQKKLSAVDAVLASLMYTNTP
jgi:hypothetical protein